jgi:hypothetical protein
VCERSAVAAAAAERAACEAWFLRKAWLAASAALAEGGVWIAQYDHSARQATHRRGSRPPSRKHWELEYEKEA